MLDREIAVNFGWNFFNNYYCVLLLNNEFTFIPEGRTMYEGQKDCFPYTPDIRFSLYGASDLR